jgi:hypothetical protein
MNRRERRYADKLRKKSKNKQIKGEMSYQQFIDSVKITPEMLNEINEYEREQRTNHPIQFNLG